MGLSGRVRGSRRQRRFPVRSAGLAAVFGALAAITALLLVTADGTALDAVDVAAQAAGLGGSAAAAGTDHGGTGGIAQQVAPAGQAFPGVAAVGALFTESNGRLGTHFCTASVVHSRAGDLAITAAHCVTGKTGQMAFVPGYANGAEPYGIWQVSQVYTDQAWQSREDEDHDVAFLRIANATDGVPVEDITGAEQLATGYSAGTPVRVIGYPDAADEPLWCVNAAVSFSATQLEFDCDGYTNGTSGGPFLTGVSTRTGEGTIIGVIGGYQQGGDTPDVSYSVAFGPSVAALYATAEASG